MADSRHAAPGSRARRNRIAALALGLLLALILLFVLLATCDNVTGDDTGQPGGPGPAASATVAPSGDSPGGTNPGGAGPGPSGSTGPGDAGSGSTGGGGTGPSASQAEPDPADTGDETDETAPTPKGGVDAGGGSGAPDRRVPLLVTGIFLLLAATGTAAYAIGRRARA